MGRRVFRQILLAINRKGIFHSSHLVVHVDNQRELMAWSVSPDSSGKNYEENIPLNTLGRSSGQQAGTSGKESDLHDTD